VAENELAEWFKLLQGGGNVALIAGLFMFWRVFLRFETIMERVIIRLSRMERAIVANDPTALRKINGADPEGLSP
jgi:hypothetical protein